MNPVGSWLFVASLVAVLCFIVAWVDGNGRIGDGTWTKEWLGDSPREIAERVGFATIVLLIMLAVHTSCLFGCSPWFFFITVLLYVLALVGWPLQSLLFCGVFLLTMFVWGRVLGIRWGWAASFFQFLLFLVSLVFAFLHLRERVLWMWLIPLPAGWIEAGAHSQRAWRAMRQPPPLNARATQTETRVRRTVAKTKTTVLPASIAATGLYMLTFVIEAGAALVRSAVYFLASLVGLSPLYIFLFVATQNNYRIEVSNFFGSNTTFDYGGWFLGNIGTSLLISTIVGLGFGFWPLVRSLFHTLFPYTRSGAGEQEREVFGAREPTREEHQKIIDAVEGIQASAGTQVVAPPSTWLVIDSPVPDAYTIGSTVYLSRAAVENTHLAGIIAHELGHVAHRDGDLVLSLRRLIIPLAYFMGVDRQPMPGGAVLAPGSNIQLDVIRNDDEKIFYRFKALQIKISLAFWFGGIGMFFLGREWARFWRARDFLADDYAVQLGQADSLMGILKTYKHVDVAQPFLLTNRPYTAERLDRLRG